ncbi:MAG TPA: hypothetical protein VES64_10105 [Allosphingosinicella sp.]|nr:hypothetical protein [Allosphingosinicella sp.]
MSLHDWFGRHVADLKFSHWDGGYFVTRCTLCGRSMVKLPGLPWKLRERRI